MLRGCISYDTYLTSVDAFGNTRRELGKYFRIKQVTDLGTTSFRVKKEIVENKLYFIALRKS